MRTGTHYIWLSAPNSEGKAPDNWLLERTMLLIHAGKIQPATELQAEKWNTAKISKPLDFNFQVSP